ncbi:Bifunctional riboflavin kinase/FMN adenylyltransferase [Cupriavidus yeoncheonensis]|uniref:Bifunctional riboflavin kinase/FMN adenylyltransferase n=1 Tax=Cupriavidus yeoncheonensis TaxID=1462994 RepID=A0A916N7R0_9BURK|nr:FAD synthetase family protein [Cupriavidus yeoncheonensis]CAG2157449.1 Bifunctional riboflavin kinase/FMN adenylyltransferase [Cupriavidus yeoncheonensis]
MQVTRGAAPLRLAASVVSIGTFDGVHRGHRAVLAGLRATGRSLGLPTVLLTFDPHPRAFLQPQSAPRMISTVDDRIALLAESNAVDHCLVLPFDRALSEASADDFVRGLLLARLGMRRLVVGANFRCGRGRQGDVDYLHRLGQANGYAVEPVRLRATDAAGEGVRCSSTEARRLIQCGDVRAAAALLARPHEIRARVVAGTPARASGAAEIRLPEGICLPPAGQYAGAVQAQAGARRWSPALVHLTEADGMARVFSDARFAPAPGSDVSVRFFGAAPAQR